MKNRNLGNVTWSLYFKLSKERRNDPNAYREFMWEVIHRYDKEIPEAFFEHAYTEDLTRLNDELGDSWYIWHSFLSRKKAESAAKLIFDTFEEVTVIEVYKDRITGSFCNAELRGKIRR